MKKIYFLVLALGLFNGVTAQTINNFDFRTLNRLLLSGTNSEIAKDINGNNMKIDANNNNQIEVSEALNVYELNLSPAIVPGFTGGDYIYSLTGLENFHNIRKLDCSMSAVSLGWNTLNSFTNLQELTSVNNSSSFPIDIHGLPHLKKLNWYHNRYYMQTVNNWAPSIILSNLPELEILDCHSNGISSLSISGAPGIKSIICDENLLTSLNLSDLPVLEVLDCNYNRLNTLVLTNVPMLKDLNCNQNTIAALNVSDLIHLETLYCGWNELTSLQTANLPALKSINCYQNHLTSLDISSSPLLEDLSCDKNNLTSLNVDNTNMLKNLSCSQNQIVSLNIQDKPYFTDLNCRNNNLVTLTTTNLPNIKNIDCTINQITSLSLVDFTHLEYFVCNNNQVKDLTIKNCTGSLGFYSNPLENVVIKDVNIWPDFSPYPLLKTLVVDNLTTQGLSLTQNTKLVSLEVSNMAALTSLNIPTASDLETVKIQNLPLISYLNCGNSGKINSLTVANMPILKTIYCRNNKLTVMNLSDIPDLTTIDCSKNLLPSLHLNSFPTLKKVSCGTNNLTALEVNNLPLLTELSCGQNQLANLDLSGCTSLQTLDCSSNLLPVLNLEMQEIQYLNCSKNQLAALDLSHLTDAYFINCSYNAITSLDVTGLTNLKTLAFAYNQVSSLDTSDLDTIENLYCSNNQLSVLDLDHLTMLNGLACSENQLTTLNVIHSPLLQYLYCGNSPLLKTVFLKNGINEEEIDLTGNPALEYVCADESQLEQIQNIIAENNYVNCHVNSYCSFAPEGDSYLIQGNIKLDGDANGCDASDAIFSNLKFNISDGVATGSLISNMSGNYSIPVASGTHTITPLVENSAYFSVSPASVTVEFPTETSPFVQNFCITPNGTHEDLEITLLPIAQAVPGFDATYKLIYKNKGTGIQSGSVSMAFNDATLDLVSASPLIANQNGNSLSWDFTNLQPLESREVSVVLNLNSPTETPALNNGDVLNFTASITSAVTDEFPNDNTFELNQTVVNSLDPNDKTCMEGRTISTTKIGEYVHYMIRFENTGTFPAQNIVVKDMIDTAKFDISSLLPIKGSHSFVTKITEGDKVEFIFQNINLPFDDANNDGFVAFKIKTKPTLVNGDTFSNTASIYFDYNFPVVTNTATTTIGALNRQDFEFSNYFNVYPNPVHDVLTISAKETIEINSISIYNTVGQLVLVIPNAKEIKTIDVSGLAAGNYFIKTHTDKGIANTKFVKN
ncbi:DUF7619 domain-containing protein [Flavobacterium humi]|uniref:T9SS type A sorting domain-containing protein n=1 Tax=Flavobacterium humi TaxID=2562683 RepID=A0A4Z0LD83_9FLAO|nr:T9SS type A sorting domain-containing protein [Flavobacterium humi]TGD59848.1 T9SS type A sorting domain-containing protein [Flavobacterium humi]